MPRKRPTSEPSKPERWYRGADIPRAVIRHFARQVAERFQPEKIIRFGSYAYGTPHADSDVDFLVVMPARNQLDQAFKIHWTIRPPFPLHILVRTPSKLKREHFVQGDQLPPHVLKQQVHSPCSRPRWKHWRALPSCSRSASPVKATRVAKVSSLV